jgi:hypothetical protein
MKQLVSMLVLGLISLNLNAQKIIEKNIDFKNQFIDIDLKFAGEIEVKTWDKSSIYVKADIMMEEEKYLNMFQVEVNENGSTIEISDNSESIFKKIWEDREKVSGKMAHYFSRGDEYQFDYVLYVPKHVRFKISSINGNLKSDLIEGDLEADLINGDIEISKFSGDLNLSTINGEIDLRIADTSLTAETIHGNIYADEKLKLQSDDRMVGQKIKGGALNAANRLKLNTINGNMYLRL